MSVYIKHFGGKYNLKTNATNFLKLNVKLHFDKIWCLYTFGERHSKGKVVILLFGNFWDSNISASDAWDHAKFYLQDTCNKN